jgi:hypothetical protein
MAQAVKPAAAIGAIWCHHEYQDSGKPCTMTTSGPEPRTTARRLMSDNASVVNSLIVNSQRMIGVR